MIRRYVAALVFALALVGCAGNTAAVMGDVSAAPAVQAEAETALIASIPISDVIYTGKSVSVDGDQVWVWVGGADAAHPDRLLHIDSETNAITKTHEIAIEGVNLRDMVAGGGSIWLIGDRRPEGSRMTSYLFRVDPVSGEVTDEVEFPLFNLTFAEEGVWAMTPETLSTLDPDTNTVTTAELPIANRLANTRLVVGAGSAWVLGRSVSGDQRILLRFDLDTLEEIDRMALDQPYSVITVGGGLVWLTIPSMFCASPCETMIASFDPSANTLTPVVPFDETNRHLVPTFMAAADDAVWVCSTPHLMYFNPDSGGLTSVLSGMCDNLRLDEAGSSMWIIQEPSNTVVLNRYDLTILR